MGKGLPNLCRAVRRRRRRLGDLRLQALAFDEHEEAAGLLVGGGNGQGAGRAGELMGFGIKLEDRIHGAKLREERRLCLIKYGGL